MYQGTNLTDTVVGVDTNGLNKTLLRRKAQFCFTRLIKTLFQANMQANILKILSVLFIDEIKVH